MRLSCPATHLLLVSAPSVPLSPAADLRLSDVTHSSARVSWTSSSTEVNGYRIMYVKSDGVQTNEVRAGDRTCSFLRPWVG